MRLIFKIFFAGNLFSMVFVTQAYTLESSSFKVPLIELYTSEGCSSCPPADKWLAGLAKGNLAVAPLAFHVDYWDKLGWKDIFATPKAAGTARQHALAALNHNSFVYTPEIFVNFVENKFWYRNSDFVSYIQGVNRQASLAKIIVKGEVAKKEFKLAASLQSRAGSALYIALYENALTSHILRGENNGATFVHERVVRELFGPYVADDKGALQVDISIKLEGLQIENIGVVLFSKDTKGEFEQALDYPAFIKSKS